MFARSRFYTPQIELVPPSDWHKALKRFVTFLKRDDIRTVDALLAYVSKDYVTSRIVAQLLFQWFPRAKRADGLVYKSDSDWQAETGISEGQMKTRKTNGALKALGVFWKKKRAEKVFQSHYGLDAEAFIIRMAKAVGKKVYEVKVLIFDKVINRPESGADQPIDRVKSTLSLTDNHTQTQLVGSVDNNSLLSGKILDISDPLIAKLVRAGLKGKNFSERYRQLPMDVIDACIADTRDAKAANEIKYTVNAYLRGALENQVKALADKTPPQSSPNSGREQETVKGNSVPTAQETEWTSPEKCEVCGQIPHWRSKECGCAESILPQASPEDVTLDNGMSAIRAWDATYNQLELQLDRASFDTWLRPAEYLRVDDGVFVVRVHNSYAQDMLQHRLYRNVRRVLSDILGKKMEIRFEVKG